MTHSELRRLSQSVMTLVLVTLLATVGSALAYHDAEPGCTSDGKTFAKGQQYDVPGHCNYHVCDGDNGWSTMACGLISVPKGWDLKGEDTTKPYPLCCGSAKPPLDIVPDVLDEVPGTGKLNIEYSGGAKVELGNELTPTQVKDIPTVTYSSKHGLWYLLAMVDPDAPSRQNPTRREFKHWLVGNIPGSDVSAGETLAEYVGAGPPQGTGLHRYVFLLYKQPKKLTFQETKTPKTSTEGRPNFSIKRFALDYNLGKPIAVNIYQAQYDDYVPTLHSQLGSGKKA